MALLLHMSLSLRATFRSRLVLAVIVLVAVFASTPLFGQTAMLAFAGDDPLYYSDLYESHKTSLESGAYETASQMLQDLVAKETDALGVVAEAESQSEYFRGLAEYSRLSLEDYDLGYLVGPTRYELEAEVALYSALVESDTPQLYGRTTAMPGLNYVAYVFAQSSPLVWMLVPVILSFSLLMANRRENLLGCAPVPDAARTFSVGVSAMLLTLCVVALAFVPGFVVSSARNGLGSLAYPVVFTQDEVVLSMTLGAVLARQLVLFLLGSLFVVVVCVGLSALTGQPDGRVPGGCRPLRGADHLGLHGRAAAGALVLAAHVVPADHLSRLWPRCGLPRLVPGGGGGLARGRLLRAGRPGPSGVERCRGGGRARGGAAAGTCARGKEVWRPCLASVTRPLAMVARNSTVTLR